MEIKGVPPRSMIMQSSRRKMFFTDDYQPVVKANSRGKVRTPGSRSLRNLVTDAQMKHGGSSSSDSMTTSDFVDFLEKCLDLKPEKRMTPQEAF
jgi:dual specificity tyrosine-phosphorylation-regulated kinase 2/3/4